MRRILTVVLVLVPALLMAQVEQQSHPEATTSQSATHQDRIAPYTLLMAELKTTLDARKLHSGDTFEAILWKDVVDQEKVVLPLGATLVGRVAQVQRHTGSQASFLYLLLEKVIVPDGREIKLWAAVEHVEAPADPRNTATAPPRLDASQKAPAPVRARSEWEEEQQSASPSGGAWPTGQKSSASASRVPPVNSKSPPVDVRKVSDAAGNTFTLLFSAKEDLKLQRGTIIAFSVLP